MKAEKGEGLILRQIPFQESKQILTIFLPEEGVTSFIAKRSNTGTFSPICELEFAYRRGRGELHYLFEGRASNSYLELRNTIEQLEYAGEIIQLLLGSQLPGKPAPLLYILTLRYLDRLRFGLKPINLVASFFLKLLTHEGLFLAKSSPNRDSHFHCASHRPFSSEEWLLIDILSCSRSFNAIETPSIEKDLFNRIKIHCLSMLEE